MADKSTTMILAALGRAAASPDGAPLFAARGAAGLFPTTAAGRQAAQRCKDEGWLRLLAAEYDAPPSLNGSGDAAVLVRKKIKTTPEICVLTGKGLTWLLGQTSPRQVLEDFVRALEARQAEAAELLAACGGCRPASTPSRPAPKWCWSSCRGRSRGRAGRKPDGSFPAFPQQPPPSPSRPTPLPRRARRMASSGASEDCPLPELYRRPQTAVPGLTVGGFHDALRRLHDAGRIYLHPWTGPLHALPEPPFALLVGHEIAYYASLRSDKVTR